MANHVLPFVEGISTEVTLKPAGVDGNLKEVQVQLNKEQVEKKLAKPRTRKIAARLYF